MRLKFWKKSTGFEPHTAYLRLVSGDKAEEAEEEVRRLREIFTEKQDAEATLAGAQRALRLLEKAVPSDPVAIAAAKTEVTAARLALSRAEDRVREAERYYRLHFPEFQGKP